MLELEVIPQHVLGKVARVGRVAHVRQARKNLLTQLICVVGILAAHDDRGLVQVVREGEAHLAPQRKRVPVSVRVEPVIVAGKPMRVAIRVLDEL